MKIHVIHDSFSLLHPVATIGTFDGVHRGHRFILDQLKEKALQMGGESVVITLWPHPRIILDQDLRDFNLLHTRDEKILELGRAGVDHLVIVPFNREIASLSACEFIQRYLVDRLGIEALLLGYDNRFGKDRKGDPEGLAQCARDNRFQLIKLPEFNSGQGRVSSTAIRKAISNGALVLAAEMLGYHYYLVGTIVEGNRIGRTLGFPTANVHPTDPYKLIPMNGVYAIRAELRGQMYGGMLNIGFRPTLDSASAVKTIEAHLFDASGDFYGEQLVIYFLERIRDEIRFSGLKALQMQLEKDKEAVKRYLKGA